MIGAQLGNWMVDKELGHGGMGSVYLAHEVEAGGTPREPFRQAAVKLLSPGLAREAGFLQRFEREIEALRRLKHPNIVQFFESGEHNGAYFYVMEYVNGPSFDDLLDRVDRLPWDEVLTLSLQICAALKHAHDHGIIHRDIKPTNLILGHEGLVKLVDFGVAKVFANSPLTATHAVVGTADYMSPEQAAGKLVTRRSDLYSLGIVMYKMVTGRTPFQAETALDMMHKHRYARFDAPNRLVPEVPQAFNDLICQLLEKEPEKRPPDALVLSRELESIHRRMASRSEHTTDQAGKGATLADQGQAERGVGPATLMSRLVRKELEDLNREGPISRLLNRAWLLVLLLAVIIGVIAYGLWPKDPAGLLHDAESLVARSEWRAAQDQLDRLDRKHAEHAYADRVNELRQEIADGQALQQARRQVNTNPAAFRAPASEAERFYREGVQDYQIGKIETARQKWRQLVEAFTGIESHRQWVVLAQDALKQSEAQTSDFAALEEAIRLAKSEPRIQAEKRLGALAGLYGDRDDLTAKAVRARIAEARRELDAAASGGK